MSDIIENIIDISLVKPGVKEEIMSLINESLKLKSSLPADFLDSIKDAERSEKEGNLVLAVSKYKELIKISNTYQDFTFINTFKRKINEIQKILDKQKSERREAEQKKKFELPDQIKFSAKVKAKPLPLKSDIISSASKDTPEQKLGGITLFEAKEAKIEPEPEMNTGFLKPEDFQIDLDLITSKKEPEPPIKPIKERSEFPKTLQSLIEKKGSSLSLRLCGQLISELEKTLGRPLNPNDVKMAAETFINQEKLMS